MKLVLTTLLAAGLATSAFAGSSGGSYDQGGKAATGGMTHENAAVTTVEVKQPRISTRNATKGAPPYAYSNPLGVGPYNDSR